VCGLLVERGAHNARVDVSQMVSEAVTAWSSSWAGEAPPTEQRVGDENPHNSPAGVLFCYCYVAVKATETIGLGERTAGATRSDRRDCAPREVAEDVECESMELTRERREGQLTQRQRLRVFVCTSGLW